MAKQTYTRVIDDLTNEVLEEGQGETLTFGFQGKSYSIDLGQKNADEFRKLMQKYTSVATQEVSRLPRAASSSAKSDKQELKKIREWAASQGIEVNARGRIAKSVEDAYHESVG
ncbi:histone-like nucleoid-structuring protein Lsr2 [Arthrobacter sp. Hiyo1]|uniref:histone-like nucleoid-structuring protein Lsr2 n=1 Tax=Arthrobacter sp. Hiyo1 TaxID=1588020 RepID=UPI00075105D5|nr:Lsr2 family protein [Arthrobacter sp. Hiyo1]